MGYTSPHSVYASNSMTLIWISVSKLFANSLLHIYWTIINSFFLESFNERYFGIVSKKSETDDSFYLYGTLVRVIDQETFFTNVFARNYIEFQVEGLQRFKI
jgi:hypothetical protein